jgi:hypothetical protein
MGKSSKGFSLLLVVILAISSSMIIESAFAQSSILLTVDPSIAVPQFTVTLADHSYDVPPVSTTTTDPYTGKQITTTEQGHHIENKTVDVSITNRPFVPKSYQNIETVNLYYDVRFKGHYSDSWIELNQYDTDLNYLPKQSNTSFTVISIPQSNYPSDGFVDFQIRAVIAELHPTDITFHFGYWSYEASGWSNIETLSMIDGSVNVTVVPTPTITPTPIQTSIPTSSPFPTPTIPELPVALLIPLIFAVLLVVGLIARKQTD